MHYRIKTGHSFLDGDGTVKSGGQGILLSPDVAQTHSDKVEAISEEEYALLVPPLVVADTPVATPVAAPDGAEHY